MSAHTKVLVVSSKTVGTNKARLMEKLGVSTARKLQRLAQQQLANGDNSGSAKES